MKPAPSCPAEVAYARILIVTTDGNPSSVLPQIEDLFFIALQALGEFSEPVPYRRHDDAALGRLEIPDDTSADSRIRERLGFARSALKRVGAADNRTRGFWGITEVGRKYLSMEDGSRQLTADINASYGDRTADPEFLERARRRAAEGRPVSLTVRELIEQWKVSRRGSAINQQIRDDLETIGLRTEPDFVNTWIDGEVRLVSVQAPEESKTPTELASVVLDDDISLTIGSIEAANRGVESVALDDTLVHAQSVMMRFDYSQLAVVTGPATIRGAISWESIAQETLRNPGATHVKQCLIDATIVRPSDHLLELVPTVVDRGFVIVQAQDRTLLGIVTMADLSEQFATLANPFVLVGEVERWMRRAIDGAFEPGELAAAVDPDDPDRDVESASNLTLGEMIRIVERPAHWERLDWAADRSVFLEAFQDVRRIRNETMHFSPDPISETDLDTLRKFLRWIRHLMEAR
jgi:predicted transcriptional regulator